MFQILSDIIPYREERTATLTKNCGKIFQTFFLVPRATNGKGTSTFYQNISVEFDLTMDYFQKIVQRIVTIDLEGSEKLTILALYGVI